MRKILINYTHTTCYSREYHRLQTLHSINELRKQVEEEDARMKQANAHVSQTDAKQGFGGKFGVQADRVDSNGKCVSQ